MPLNYSLAKIEKFEELLNDEQAVKQPYETIILSTMFVGFKSITEENFEKFYNRLNLLEKVNGAFLYKDRKPSYIQLEDVKRMVGLHTNANDKTRAAFLKWAFYDYKF